VSGGETLTSRAQSVARERRNPTVEPIHVLVALLNRPRKRNVANLLARCEVVLSALPGSSGGDAGIPVSDAAAQALTEGESIGEDALENQLTLELLTGVTLPIPAEPAHAPVPPSRPQQPSSSLTKTWIPAPADARPADPADTLERALGDLDALIGLEYVKTQVRGLIATHEVNRKRTESGLPPIPVSLHLAFTGAPGTGKTTVARLVARIYRTLGLLPLGQLIEVDRSALVSGYVGQTAIQVRETLERSRGGVLFIDEAYALATNGGADFGAEAVSTLVKGMEDMRDSLAVIAAGYPEPMEAFLESNAGLRSRFTTFIEFPDYSTEELLAIFDRLCIEHDITTSPEARMQIRSLIEVSSGSANHGNARFIRNLFEEMFRRMSVRASADGMIETHEISTFEAEDVPVGREERIRFGFA
jgi:stage V sporulation protein K